jgi:hypothetical protein
LAYISQIAGGLGILVAAAAYVVHRRQLNFNMVMECNQRFQEILVDLEAEDGAPRNQAKKRYVDLCNEQLFYFSKGYLPREVIEEWLDGMIDYLPLFDSATGEVRPDHPGIVELNLLEGYPRIRTIFTVDASYGLASRDQRMALVRRIGNTVRPEPIRLVLWRDLIDHFSRPDRSNR